MNASDIIVMVKKAEKGIVSIGTSIKSEVFKAGLAWVGDNPKQILDIGGELIGYSSQDGMRCFRYSYKTYEGRFRANFQQNFRTDSGQVLEILNAHVDIID